MPQSSLLGWVKPKPVEKPATKRSTSEWVYWFFLDFPEGIMTPDGPRGPFWKGDLVSGNALPPAVWAVLLKRGAVQPFRLLPEWPGTFAKNGGGDVHV